MPDKAAVRRQLEAAIAYVRSRIYTLEDYSARDILRQYQKAYEAMEAKLDAAFQATTSGGTWNSTDAAFIKRTQVLTEQMAGEMERLNAQVHDTIVRDQINAYRASFFGNAWIVDKFSPKDYTAQMPVLPTEAIRAQMLMPYENGTSFFRLEANRHDFIGKIKQAMVQSQINGDSIYDAQKRLADLLGVDIGRRTKNERLANQGAFYRTEMIARTELLRGSNLGALAVYDANKDVVKEWEYLATLDGRTCPTCGPLDGKKYPIEDTSDLPPKHPNCRCTSAPVTVSFAEMGLGGLPEMGHSKRASLFGPVAGSLSYSQWAAREGIMQSDDGGLRDLPPSKPARSPGAAPVRAQALKGKGLAVR